jgi:hypothetical protein
MFTLTNTCGGRQSTGYVKLPVSVIRYRGEMQFDEVCLG